MSRCDMRDGKTGGDVRGVVFDIRRFSVHDGRGLRTTVFLKGCPLRCRWCQNPEGLESSLKPIWLSGACINCGVCWKTTGADSAEEAAALLRTWTGEDPCAVPPRNVNEVMDACPAKAFVWNGRMMSVDEAAAEVEKDKVFFAHSGGVTLSGGEPLAQADFALALLARLRQAGIHTAMETSLFAPPDIVDEAAALCDQIFADCKIIDEQKHLAATGRSNELILKNLDRLLRGKHASKMIVRLPLIPGFTCKSDFTCETDFTCCHDFVRSCDSLAGGENIKAVADFIYACNQTVPLELLNYNPLAAAKYPYGDLPGLELQNCKPYSTEQMEQLRGIVRERGVRCIESV